MFHKVTSVRERLWLLAHDDRELRPHVDRRALGGGLVAATLVDLLLHKLIDVRQGRIHPLPGPIDPPGGDQITSSILVAIRGDGTSRLADVLRGARAETSGSTFNPYLRVYERTQTAMVEAGILVEHRRPQGLSRYRLADPNTITRHRGQFNTRLVSHAGGADPGTDCLCALVWALNIHRALLMPYSASEADVILRDITERLPARAGVGSLLATTPQLARSVRRAVGDLTATAS